ncbi:MAG: Nif3-like dinuclear metal center hexameric protein [Saprospiraceae bacterium]|nr:Nif3-like dinuclear metal center hexameric protein [Saprospiraceae bacterium]
MKIKEIIEFLNSVAHPSYQESYDNSGLIVGNSQWEVTGILVCLDSIESIIDEAITKNCNLVIAHHPIVFNGLKTFTGRNYIERTVIKAIKNDIAIFAVHTNLDNVYINGVNTKISQKLGLINTQILAPAKGVLNKLYVFVPDTALEKVSEALFDAGAGEIGNYSECSFVAKGEGSFKANENANPVVGQKGLRHYEAETKLEVIFETHIKNELISALLKAHPYEEVAYDIVVLENQFNRIGAGIVGELKNPIDTHSFLKKIKEEMNTDCVRYTSLCYDQIQRVAVCGGAGSFLLGDAIKAKADIFITSDFKYHQFFDAENRIIIADIGHFESEQFTIELFYDLLTQKFCNFAIHCTDIKTNPINYL